VVNQYGKKRMLSELYGVAGGGLSFEDRLWIASQQMCLGVNLLNHHLSLYTMAGCRKRDYPQNMFYPQPWWPLNRLIDDQLSRTCVALAQGKYIAEALVIHPQESTFVLWKSRTDAQSNKLGGESFMWDRHPTADGVRDRIFELDKQVKNVIDAILGSQRTFDFGDETILAEAGEVIIESGRAMLRVEQMAYPVVILPGMATIAASTVDLLEQFHKVGGVVLRCGAAPALLDGEPSQRLNQWIKSVSQVELADLPAKLRGHVPPAVELIDVPDEDARMLYVHLRDLGDGERLVYLTNLHRERSFAAKVRFRGSFASAYLLETTSGQERQLLCESTAKGLVVELPFEPTRYHLLRLSPSPATNDGISLMPPRGVETIDLPAEAWRVERLDDNAIALDYAAWREEGGSWSSRPMPLVAVQQRLNDLKFNGALELRYPVRVANLSPQRKVHLVVEYPERYRIAVNGREVRYAGLPAWRDFRWMPIDITGLLHGGDNTIELVCENFVPGDLTSIHDQFARYGTEIEAVYLVGDFAVEATRTPEQPECPWWKKFELPPIEVKCFANESLRLKDPTKLSCSDSTEQGLPFYAGRLRLTTALPSLERDGQVWLQVDQLDAAVAEVSIDGSPIGHLLSHPLRVDLSDAIAKGGKELSITLYGTLRNLLGPHHHTMGEMPSVGPHSFHPPWPAEEDRAQWIMQWSRGEISPSDWSERYCMVSFGSLGRIQLQRAQA
jgi:hypothetical protein